MASSLAETTTTMNDLPPEILAHIFGFLAADRPAPSEVRLHEQPSDDMLQTDINYQDLKSVSRVNKAFRREVLPLLFSHVLWRPQISSLKDFFLQLQPISLLQFLLNNRLEHKVSTFTLLVNFEDKDVDPRHVAHQIRPSDLEWLWDQLFSVVDPLRFTIIAPPTTLVAFMNRMLFLEDAWSFGIPYHILSLARSSRKPVVSAEPSVITSEIPYEIETKMSNLNVSSSSDTNNAGESSSSSAGPSSLTHATKTATSAKGKHREEATPCALFTLRSWTSVLLNEGSFTRVYQTYEFFLRSPPSMLSALLGFGEYPNDTPLLPDTIVDFNYVAIFPLSSHFYTLLCHLPPRLDRFFVQLTPRPGNRILYDQEQMRQIEMSDLWMERNTAYSYLIGQLTVPNPNNKDRWSALQIFESGDAADKESWDMAVAFLERSGVRNWKAEQDGVLVRVDDEGNATQELRDVVAGHILGEDVMNGSMLDP